MLPTDYCVTNDVIWDGELHVLVCFSNSQIVSLAATKTITVNMGSNAVSAGNAYTLSAISAGTAYVADATHQNF